MTLKKFSALAAACSFTLACVSAHAYQYGQPRYGAGATMPSPPRQYVPPAPMPDPTKTRTYKLIEMTTPVVRGLRDCSAGAIIGSWRGPVGMATGCAGAVTPNLSPYRPLNAY